MEIVFIDHYDSFSFNLLDWLGSTDQSISLRHVYFDDEDAIKKLLKHPLPVVLSPGPNSPLDAPLSMKVAQKLMFQVPMLGVCLGHQIMGVAVGGQLVRSVKPFHGSTRRIFPLNKSSIFSDNFPIEVGTYNSLCVAMPTDRIDQVTFQNEWGEVEMVEYQGREDSYAAIGVQFHPESFLSKGVSLLRERYFSEVIKYFSLNPQR